MVRTTYNKRSKRIKILINYHITINFYLATATEKNFDNSNGFNFLLVSIPKVTPTLIGLNEKL